MWHIVDFNLFTPGLPLPDNTVLITEQLPGLVISTDVTTLVNHGYFGSWNRPYNSVINEISCCAAMVR